MGLYLNFYLLLYLYPYVLHSDDKGKIHYSYLNLLIPILEVWKL